MNALIKKHTYYYNANLFDNILITAFHYNPSPSEFYVFYFMNIVILVWGEGHRLCQATRQTPGTRNNRNTCLGPCCPCPDTNLHLAPQAGLIPPQNCCLFPERSIPRLPESVLCHHPGLSSRSSLQENCPGLSPLSSSRPGVGTAFLERTSSKHFRFCSPDSAASSSSHLSPRWRATRRSRAIKYLNFFTCKNTLTTLPGTHTEVANFTQKNKTEWHQVTSLLSLGHRVLRLSPHSLERVYLGPRKDSTVWRPPCCEEVQANCQVTSAHQLTIQPIPGYSEAETSHLNNALSGWELTESIRLQNVVWCH